MSTSTTTTTSLPLPSQPPVLVTYSATDTLLHSAFAAHVLDSIRTQLPLRNVHWKTSAQARAALAGGAEGEGGEEGANFANATAISGGGSTITTSAFSSSSSSASSGAAQASIKTLPTLPVSLIDLSLQSAKAQSRANAFLTPTSALETPLLHLYLLVCDDVDAYRTVLRDEIHAWLRAVRAREGLRAKARRIRKGGLRNEHLLATSSDSGGGDASTAAAAAAALAGELASEAEKVAEAESEADEAEPEPEFLILLINPSSSSSSSATSSNDSPLSPTSATSGGGGTSPGASEGGTGTGAGSKVGRFYSSLQKGTVLDALRRDFNTPPTPGSASSQSGAGPGAGRRDRIVHLTRLPPLTVPGTSAASLYRQQSSSSHPSSSSSTSGGGGKRFSVDPTLFADLVARMKECLAHALDALAAAQAHEFARAEATRERLVRSATSSSTSSSFAAGSGHPGSGGGGGGLGLAAAHGLWDFSSWASARLYLGETLSGLGLAADALAQYALVDSLILRTLPDRPGSGSGSHTSGSGSGAPGGSGAGHPFFPTLGLLHASDDSSPVLDYARKPYADLLQRGALSLFDARAYLFARRARVLAAAPPHSFHHHNLPGGGGGAGANVARIMREAQAWLVGTGRIIGNRQVSPASGPPS